MWGQREVRCISLHNNQGFHPFTFQLLIIESLVDGVSSIWWPEDDETRCWESLDHTSKTWEIPRKSFRRWSPLQILQGNFGLRVVLVGIPTLSLERVVGWDLVSGIPLFFLIFHFFFFLCTWLLVLQLSIGEEGEREEDTSAEEGEGSTRGCCSYDGN